MDAVQPCKAFIDIRRETSGRGSKEHVWIEKTFGGYRVLNIPFQTRGVSYGDVVAVDEEAGEIIWVERLSEYRNGVVGYRVEPGEPQEVSVARAGQVRQGLGGYGILTEGLMLGVTAVAVPSSIDDQQFWDIVKAIPQIDKAEITPRKSAKRLRLKRQGPRPLLS